MRRALGLAALMCPALACAAPAFQDSAPVAVAIRAAALALAPPGAEISLGSVDGAKSMQACTTPLSVSFSGMAPYEQAAAHCGAPGWTLYVTVTVAQSQAVVVAARPIVAGQVIAQGDLMIAREPVQNYAGRQVFYDTSALVGADALISLQAGTIVSAENIGQPVVVKAGQLVAVEVISGGVEVSVNAMADETGRIGDTILMTNPSSGRRFSALVTASGPVLRLQS
jgi:flagella basal body P-ring formation protein FlgA